MIEPLYGSASALWPQVPSPGLGWPQLPIAISKTASARPIQGPGGPGSELYDFNAGSVPFTQPSISSGYGSGFTFAPAVFGMTGLLPGIVTQSMAAFSSLPTLLNAIAVRRGQPMGPTNDQEAEDFIYDVLDVLSGANDVELKVDGARVTLTGSVPHKRLKHDIGEIAWAVPGINDVQNNLTIVARRRSRGSREGDAHTNAPARKQA